MIDFLKGRVHHAITVENGVISSRHAHDMNMNPGDKPSVLDWDLLLGKPRSQWESIGVSRDTSKEIQDSQTSFSTSKPSSAPHVLLDTVNAPNQEYPWLVETLMVCAPSAYVHSGGYRNKSFYHAGITRR